MHNVFGIETDPTAGASQAVAVTPSDSTVLAMTRSLYVGGAGNLRLLLWNDTATVDFIAVAVGSVLPLRVRKVYNAGTTATNIVALY